MEWDVLIYGSLAAIAVITIHKLLNTVEKLERKMKRMEICFDLLFERLDIDASTQIPERIKQLALNPRRRVEAIALYREETGATLQQSAEVIRTYVAEHYDASR